MNDGPPSADAETASPSSAASWTGVFCLGAGFLNNDAVLKTSGFNTILITILVNLINEHFAIPAFEELDKAIESYNGKK